MDSESRMERLMRLLGSENLPPKLPQTKTESGADTTAKDSTQAQDSSTKPESNDEPPNSSDDWWNVTHVQGRRQPSNQQTGNAVAPVISADGESTYSLDPRQGEPAPFGVRFCPFIAVTKLPYKFIKKEFMQQIATAFFDAGKIWNREWDVYYVWSNHYPTGKPITFIPEHQLQNLLDEINAAFPAAKVEITDHLVEESLVIDFDDIDCAEIRPQYLGKSTSREQLDYWSYHVPFPAMIPDGKSKHSRSLEAFKAKMERTMDATKNKSAAAKKKRQAEAVVKRQDMVRSNLRAQRYLGLFATAEDPQLPNISNLTVTPIDINVPVPHPFDQDVIFIAIDVEAYERAPRQVTEVGIATLDTRDLQGQAPGNVGKNWQKFIRGRHLRVNDYKHLTNKTFVTGCPGNFEFGKSQFVPKDNVKQAVANCFKQPFSGPGSPLDQEKRNIVLVGHDVGGDINYLMSIGYSVYNLAGLIEKVDTVELFRAYSKDPASRGLGNILFEFDLTGWYLHNAGNDAVYTLWAMLAICISQATGQGQEKQAECVKKRAETAVELAKERAKGEAEGWERVDDDDGGVPVPLVAPGKKPGPTIS